MERYDAQRVLWKVTKIRRLAYCGRVVTDKAAGVTIRLSGTAGEPGARAGFSGLQTCASVWSCPVCSEKINAQRQADLTMANERWVNQGNTILLGTFTVQHNRRQSLAELWDAVAPSWSKVTAGASWAGGKRMVGDRQRFGVAGFARLVEVTHGRHGWHPHLHVLFFIRGEIADNEIEDFRRRLFGRWESALAKRGFRALDKSKKGEDVGLDLRRVLDATYVAEYFAKNGYRPKGTSTAGAAYEVTGSHSKKAGAGRTPFQMLAELVEGQDGPVDKTTGELREGWDDYQATLRLWHEWEETSRGRLQLTWSRGLRDLLDLGRELTDDEIVELEELMGADKVQISTEDWKAGGWALRRDELLSWTESGELEARYGAWLAEQRAKGLAGRRHVT